ncbi:hypothetical protein [Streptomyces lateritius]|uniref:hypothetical protein n=1 Tax=Streptomyces lateritius TaxID=67313 RepID=UPI001C8BDFF9|nr:hypothetical protein [Streptomyces lateritius]MBX9425480.1 hypothetical protein [Streptomyces lateritius]
MSASDSQDRAWQRHRTAEQIDADVRRWRADRRMREALEATAICQAIWQLPDYQPARKENGQ